MNLPLDIRPKVRRWMGNNDKLYQNLFNQSVFQVMNMYTRETTIFNPLREKRPKSVPAISELQYIEKKAHESANSCDFATTKDSLQKINSLDWSPDYPFLPQTYLSWMPYTH